MCLYTCVCHCTPVELSTACCIGRYLPCVRRGLMLSHMAGSLAPKLPGILLSPLILFRDHRFYSFAWVPGGHTQILTTCAASALPTELSP